MPSTWIITGPSSVRMASALLSALREGRSLSLYVHSACCCRNHTRIASWVACLRYDSSRRRA